MRSAPGILLLGLIAGCAGLPGTPAAGGVHGHVGLCAASEVPPCGTPYSGGILLVPDGPGTSVASVVDVNGEFAATLAPGSYHVAGPRAGSSPACNSPSFEVASHHDVTVAAACYA